MTGYILFDRLILLERRDELVLQFGEGSRYLGQAAQKLSTVSNFCNEPHN